MSDYICTMKENETKPGEFMLYVPVAFVGLLALVLAFGYTMLVLLPKFLDWLHWWVYTL